MRWLDETERRLPNWSSSAVFGFLILCAMAFFIGETIGYVIRQQRQPQAIIGDRAQRVTAGALALWMRRITLCGFAS
jgi:hypothetical protein